MSTEPSPSEHRNVTRVRELLAAAAMNGEVRTLADSARTSAEAATAVGVEVGAIAKTLIFLAAGEPVVVIASGSQRVDTAALSMLLDGKKITRADAEAVRAATGYAIGGVSPVGLPEGLVVFVEKALAEFDVVWAAAGTPHAVYPTTYEEILSITRGTSSSVGQTQS